MGKKLKYCNSCEEGFAERFTFCPTCGGWLETVEMSPVGEQSAHTDDLVPAAEAPEPKFEVLRPAVNEPAASVEEPEVQAPEIQAFEREPISFADETHEPEILAAEEPYIEPIHEEPEHIVEATAAGSYSEEPATAAFSEPAPTFAAPSSYAYKPDDDFHVTVIQEKNSGQRTGLLLGATVLMITIMLTSVVVSIFGKDIDIGSIGGDSVFYSIPEVEVPLDVEKEKEPEVKKNDDSGGGGGGGNKNPDPASKGSPPNMMKNPDVAPSTSMDRLTNPTLTQRVGVNGPERLMADPSQRYGVLNGADKPSDGPGSGTGIGTGRGGGVGSGNGSGLGSGNGGGMGSGNGGGIGGGNGEGGNPPPDIVKGESTALAITSKPRPNYTDAARQNNIQGVVRLKVTFNANGSIGSISAISGLPNGLTEQAIAAAKNMRFTPKKVNGVPQSVARVVEFSFTIY